MSETLAPLAGREPFPLASGARVLVIAEGDNPSFAYFVRPFLAASSADIVIADSRQPPTGDISGFDAAVVVRYLPARWQAPLDDFHRRGCRVAYFMDDDLMDARAHAGLPLRYRWKLARRALWQRSAIERLCSDFWVSTPWLATKYSSWAPRVLAVRADAATRPASATVDAAVHAEAGAPVTVCYHGTASHVAEQRWLPQVIRGLQEACGDTRFGIVGDTAVARLFRGIPRVTVSRPLSWPDYLAWTRTQHCDIALAPLLPGPFNAARSPTKFLDNTRMGAAGIYADVTPYREFVRHDVDGLLVPMTPAAWTDALVTLVRDGERRRALALAARRRVATELCG